MCTIGIGSIYYKFHTLYKFHERKIANSRLLSVLRCTLGVGCLPKITHCLKYFSKKDFIHSMSVCFFSTLCIFSLKNLPLCPHFHWDFPKSVNFTEFSKFRESLQNPKVVWLPIALLIWIQLHSQW